MDKDEMMRMIEQVAAQSEQDRERTEIEAYIHRVCHNLRISLRNEMHFGNTGIPEPTHSKLEAWEASHRDRVSFQVAELARAYLRKELLGE